MHSLLFNQFVAKVQTGRVDFSCGDRDLRNLDVVLVRTMPPGSLEQVVARMDMLAGLEACGVRVINSPRALECAVDKYLTTQRLALAGIPVPATIVCENSDTALEAFERLGRDVVVKPLFGAEGRGIMRVSDPEPRCGRFVHSNVSGPCCTCRRLSPGQVLIFESCCSMTSLSDR